MNDAAWSALWAEAKRADMLKLAHLGDELVFKLISVCHECHKRIHAVRKPPAP